MRRVLAASLLLSMLATGGFADDAAPSADVSSDAVAAAGSDDGRTFLRDLRRWEIVTFGSFPFTMFFATIGMNMYRWNRESGMSWDDRRYAPWPVTSAGAVPMTDSEQKRTILIAAGLSATVAVVDHLLVRARRQRERRRLEAARGPSVIIRRTPPSLGGPSEDGPAPEVAPRDGVPGDGVPGDGP